ncbi:uncharacterized protein LOC128221831 isoform X2 [Mya arenaria]|uniref:uncharacterized protein LOC128221831 isoform X2 n=1 Tax=Mya arenaria TaxID=6604 RepID=UPI0022E0471C|nr:uncharacterized protein LOC128221831 isoform X2 [Mya arenaria]
MRELLAFNGKAGKLNEGVFTTLKLICRPEKAKQAKQGNAPQGNNTTRVSKGDVPLYNTRLVIRTVEKHWAGDLSEEDIEKNLEQTILHYAIVPQVAYYRNAQTVSFVAPFFGGGTLDEVIQREREETAKIATERPSKRKPEIEAERPSERKQEITAESSQTLEWRDKLRILYQICRAIEYLHQPPECKRKPVSHGDICMQNVLLDEQKNARLLFLSPKSVEGEVGDKQFQEDKNKDVQAFTDMAHDLLGQSGKKAASYLLPRIQEAVTITDIKKELESGLRKEDIKYWTSTQDDGKKKDDDGKKKDGDGKKKDAGVTKKDRCEICCVNKPEMTFVKLQHAKSCPSKIKICVGCLWNWQYNPVKCHSCDQEKIQSPVGDRWGAILIAGTDTNEDITKCFEDDIKKLENEVITNVTLMGVRDNVVTVKKSTTTYREQLKNAFSKIGISKINTIVLVYSGHHGDEGFQLDTHTLKDCELVDEFNRLKHVTKVIAFLDCCHPKKLILDKKAVLQFNAVTSKQSAISRPRGSLFVNDIVNVLTNPWEYKCFENTPLIRDYDMHKYFNKHPYNSSIETSQLSNTDGDLDHILTFRPVDPGWLKALEESLESSPLQDFTMELFKLYDKTASKMSIPLDIDVVLEKIYESPQLTLKNNAKDEGNDITELIDIFQNEKGTLAKTVLVEGEPGSGKSSLCKKIVHEWCKTKGRTIHSRTKTKWNEISCQFEFVFYIILREAMEECSIKKMIVSNIVEKIGKNETSIKKEIGIDKTRGEELLGEILKSNTCLLLLDGLDEWQHPNGCFLDERIPHDCTSWENCTILITTRPYNLAELIKKPSQIDKHVMLKGVSRPENLVEKIVSSLNDLPGKGPSQNTEGARTPLNHKLCIQEVKGKDLWHFSKCPIMLAHVVWLWYKDELSTSMNLSDLYDTLLKERCFESCDKKIQPSGPKDEEIISTLSEIAFKKLFAEDENHTIVFEIDEEKNVTFKKHKKASLESGIISSTQVRRGPPRYYFLHKTVQEYLAALWISKDVAEGCSHIKHTYKKNRRESGVSLSQILIFLCNMNTKAAEDLSKEMNELFTDFCDRVGYSHRESEMLQNTILRAQKELDRRDKSGRKLCLKHIFLKDHIGASRVEKDLEQYVKTNQSHIVSLFIGLKPNIPFHFANSSNNEVLDLKNCKGLKYLRLLSISFKDVIGLNLSNLVECSIHFEHPQQAPNLTSTFYNYDIECLQAMKKLDLSGLKDFHWLHKDSERSGVLDLRRLGNLEHLGLNGLPYSDVVNLPVFRLHRLEVGFNELQQAPQFMSMLITHQTCKREIRHWCCRGVP